MQGTGGQTPPQSRGTPQSHLLHSQQGHSNRLPQSDKMVNQHQPAKSSRSPVCRGFCPHLSSIVSDARYIDGRGGEPGCLVTKNMSRTTDFHGQTLPRQVSVLLTLLLCTVFVVPLPMTDSASAGNCSVDDAIVPDAAAPAAHGPDGKLPFPCQNRPCGCRSASNCLKKCCCFRPSQNSATARIQTRKPDRSTQTNNTKTAPATDADQTRWHTVSFIQSMECQGLGIASVCFVVSLTAPAAPLPLAADPDDYPRPASQTLPAVSLQPPVPPPKLFA